MPGFSFAGSFSVIRASTRTTSPSWTRPKANGSKFSRSHCLRRAAWGRTPEMSMPRESRGGGAATPRCCPRCSGGTGVVPATWLPSSRRSDCRSAAGPPPAMWIRRARAPSSSYVVLRCPMPSRRFLPHTGMMFTLDGNAILYNESAPFGSVPTASLPTSCTVGRRDGAHCCRATMPRNDRTRSPDRRSGRWRRIPVEPVPIFSICG